MRSDTAERQVVPLHVIHRLGGTQGASSDWNRYCAGLED